MADGNPQVVDLYNKLSDNGLIGKEDYSVDKFENWLKTPGAINSVYSKLKENDLIGKSDYSAYNLKDWLQVGDKGFRNNNPLNLREVGETKGFRKFNTLEQGLEAGIYDLQSKIEGKTRTGLNGNSSIKDLIYVFSPPNGEGNTLESTNNYVKHVSNVLGVDASTPIGEIGADNLAHAMMTMESPDSARYFNAHYKEMTEDPDRGLAEQLKNNPEAGSDSLLSRLAHGYEKMAGLKKTKTLKDGTEVWERDGFFGKIRQMKLPDGRTSYIHDDESFIGAAQNVAASVLGRGIVGTLGTIAGYVGDLVEANFDPEFRMTGKHNGWDLAYNNKIIEAGEDIKNVLKTNVELSREYLEESQKPVDMSGNWFEDAMNQIGNMINRGDNASYWYNDGAEGIASVMEFMVPGWIAGKGIKKVLDGVESIEKMGKLGKATAHGIGALAYSAVNTSMESAVEAREIFKEAMAEQMRRGKSEDEARKISAGLASDAFVDNSILVGSSNVFEGLMNLLPFKGKIIAGAGILGNAVLEGFQEAGQFSISNYERARIYGDLSDVSIKERLKGIGHDLEEAWKEGNPDLNNSIGLGMILGGGMTAGTQGTSALYQIPLNYNAKRKIARQITDIYQRDSEGNLLFDDDGKLVPNRERVSEAMKANTALVAREAAINAAKKLEDWDAVDLIMAENIGDFVFGAKENGKSDDRIKDAYDKISIKKKEWTDLKMDRNEAQEEYIVNRAHIRDKALAVYRLVKENNPKLDGATLQNKFQYILKEELVKDKLAKVKDEKGILEAKEDKNKEELKEIKKLQAKEDRLGKLLVYYKEAGTNENLKQQKQRKKVDEEIKEVANKAKAAQDRKDKAEPTPDDVKNANIKEVVEPEEKLPRDVEKPTEKLENVDTVDTTETEEEVSTQSEDDNVSNAEYNEFVDKGTVSSERLQSIASKVMNQEDLDELIPRIKKDDDDKPDDDDPPITGGATVREESEMDAPKLVEPNYVTPEIPNNVQAGDELVDRNDNVYVVQSKTDEQIQYIPKSAIENAETLRSLGMEEEASAYDNQVFTAKITPPAGPIGAEKTAEEIQSMRDNRLIYDKNFMPPDTETYNLAAYRAYDYESSLVEEDGDKHIVRKTLDTIVSVFRPLLNPFFIQNKDGSYKEISVIKGTPSVVRLISGDESANFNTALPSELADKVNEDGTVPYSVIEEFFATNEVMEIEYARGEVLSYTLDDFVPLEIRIDGKSTHMHVHITPWVNSLNTKAEMIKEEYEALKRLRVHILNKLDKGEPVTGKIDGKAPGVYKYVDRDKYPNGKPLSEFKSNGLFNLGLLISDGADGNEGRSIIDGKVKNVELAGAYPDNYSTMSVLSAVTVSNGKVGYHPTFTVNRTLGAGKYGTDSMLEDVQASLKAVIKKFAGEELTAAEVAGIKEISKSHDIDTVEGINKYISFFIRPEGQHKYRNKENNLTYLDKKGGKGVQAILLTKHNGKNHVEIGFSRGKGKGVTIHTNKKKLPPGILSRFLSEQFLAPNYNHLAQSIDPDKTENPITYMDFQGNPKTIDSYRDFILDRTYTYVDYQNSEEDNSGVWSGHFQGKISFSINDFKKSLAAEERVKLANETVTKPTQPKKKGTPSTVTVAPAPVTKQPNIEQRGKKRETAIRDFMNKLQSDLTVVYGKDLKVSYSELTDGSFEIEFSDNEESFGIAIGTIDRNGLTITKLDFTEDTAFSLMLNSLPQVYRQITDENQLELLDDVDPVINDEIDGEAERNTNAVSAKETIEDQKAKVTQEMGGELTDEDLEDFDIQFFDTDYDPFPEDLSQEKSITGVPQYYLDNTVNSMLGQTAEFIVNNEIEMSKVTNMVTKVKSQFLSSEKNLRDVVLPAFQQKGRDTKNIDANIKLLELINKNWDRVNDLFTDRFNSLYNEVPETDINNQVDEDRIIKLNPADKLRRDVKILMLSIPAYKYVDVKQEDGTTVKEWQVVKHFLNNAKLGTDNLIQYTELDDVVDVLFANLASTNYRYMSPTYGAMKKQLDNLSKSYPWVNNIIEIVEKNDYIRSRFVRSFYTIDANFMKVVYGLEGDFTKIIPNISNGKAVDKVIDNWKAGFENNLAKPVSKEIKNEIVETRSLLPDKAEKIDALLFGLQETKSPSAVLKQFESSSSAELKDFLSRLIKKKINGRKAHRLMLQELFNTLGISLSENTRIKLSDANHIADTKTGIVKFSYDSIIDKKRNFKDLRENILEAGIAGIADPSDMLKDNLFTKLAIEEVKYNESINNDRQFRDAGKSVANYQIARQFYLEVAKLQDQRTGYLDKIVNETPYARSSYWNDMIKGGELNYGTTALNATERFGLSNTERSLHDYSPKKLREAMLMHFLVGIGRKKGMQTARFFGKAISDSKFMTLFVTGKPDLFKTNKAKTVIYQYNNDPENPGLDDKTVNLNEFLFSQLIEPELNRILEVGESRFYNIPTLTLENFPGVTSYIDLAQKIKQDPTIKQTAVVLMNEFISREVNDMGDFFIENGIGWDGKKWRGVPEEAVSYYDKRLENANYKQIQNAIVEDFVVNYMVAHSNASMLVYGDPTIYEKGGMSTSMDNMVKRIKMYSSPKEPFDLDVYKELTGNTDINYLVAADVESAVPSIDWLKGILGEENVSKYMNNNHADAQEFVHWKHHLATLVALGEITKDDYAELADAIERRDLNDSQLKKVMGAVKPLYSYTKVEDQQAKKYYVKSSHIPIIPGYSGQLEALLPFMEDKDIDRIAFESAVKLGKKDTASLFNDDLTLKNLDTIGDLGTARLPLPAEGYGKQLEVPPKDKYEVKDQTQVQKLIAGNVMNEIVEYDGKQITVRELASIRSDLYQQIHSKLGEAARELISTGGILDQSKLGRMLENVLKDGLYSDNARKAVETKNGKFSVPLWLTSNYKQIESIISAYLNKGGIKDLKRPGMGLAQASSIGMGKVKPYHKDFSSSIIKTKRFDQKGLKHGVERDGKIVSEIIVPWKFKEDIANFTDSSGRIDPAKIPERFLKTFGYRTPNQGHSSQIVFEIVGFLPANMGNVAYVPTEIVSQMGSDFDIDKIYMNIRAPKITQLNGGQMVFQDSDNALDKLWNKVLDTEIAIIGSSNKVIQRSVRASLDTPMDLLSQTGNDIQDAYQENNKVLSHISPNYQIDRYQLGSEGAKLIGVAANAITFSFVLQNSQYVVPDNVMRNISFDGVEGQPALYLAYDSKTINKIKSAYQKDYQGSAYIMDTSKEDSRVLYKKQDIPEEAKVNYAVKKARDTIAQQFQEKTGLTVKFDNIIATDGPNGAIGAYWDEDAEIAFFNNTMQVESTIKVDEFMAPIIEDIKLLQPKVYEDLTEGGTDIISIIQGHVERTASDRKKINKLRYTLEGIRNGLYNDINRELISEDYLPASALSKVQKLQEIIDVLSIFEEEQSPIRLEFSNLTPNYYSGNITPDESTVFVFGSNPEGKHEKGAAKIAKDKFGAIYGQGEGLQGNAYAIPTKDLRDIDKTRSVPSDDIINSISKMYETARANPSKTFKVAYRNKGDEVTLSGYSANEMIDMFKGAGPIPSNVMFSEEWSSSIYKDAKSEVKVYEYNPNIQIVTNNSATEFVNNTSESDLVSNNLVDVKDINYKSNNFSATLSAALDNQKDNILERVHYNSNVSSAVTAMQLLGFDNNNHIFPLIAQPIVKEYVRNLSTMSPQEAYVAARERHVESIGSHNPKEVKFTNAGLFRNIEKYSSGEMDGPYYASQVEALDAFYHYQNDFSYLTGLARLTNIHTRGTGKDMYSMFNLEADIEAAMSDGRMASVLNNGTQSHAIGQVIEHANLMRSGMGAVTPIDGKNSPFVLVRQQIVDYLSMSTKFDPNSKKNRDILNEATHNAMRGTVFAKIASKIGMAPTDTLRKEYLYGSANKPSLVDIIDSIKSGGYKLEEQYQERLNRNAFLKILKKSLPLKKKGNLLPVLSINATQAKRLDVNQVDRDIVDLYNNPIKLTDTYTTRDLVKDLMVYSFTIGHQQTGRSITKYIPNELINRTIVDSGYLEEALVELNDYTNPEDKPMSGLSYNLLLHNPDLIHEVDDNIDSFATASGSIITIMKNYGKKEKAEMEKANIANVGFNGKVTFHPLINYRGNIFLFRGDYYTLMPNGGGIPGYINEYNDTMRTAPTIKYIPPTTDSVAQDTIKTNYQAVNDPSQMMKEIYSNPNAANSHRLAARVFDDILANTDAYPEIVHVSREQMNTINTSSQKEAWALYKGKNNKIYVAEDLFTRSDAPNVEHVILHEIGHQITSPAIAWYLDSIGEGKILKTQLARATTLTPQQIKAMDRVYESFQYLKQQAIAKEYKKAFSNFYEFTTEVLANEKLRNDIDKRYTSQNIWDKIINFIKEIVVNTVSTNTHVEAVSKIIIQDILTATTDSQTRKVTKYQDPNDSNITYKVTKIGDYVVSLSSFDGTNTINYINAEAKYKAIKSYKELAPADPGPVLSETKQESSNYSFTEVDGKLVIRNLATNKIVGKSDVNYKMAMAEYKQLDDDILPFDSEDVLKYFNKVKKPLSENMISALDIKYPELFREINHHIANIESEINIIKNRSTKLDKNKKFQGDVSSIKADTAKIQELEKEMERMVDLAIKVTHMSSLKDLYLTLVQGENEFDNILSKSKLSTSEINYLFKLINLYKDKFTGDALDTNVYFSEEILDALPSSDVDEIREVINEFMAKVNGQYLGEVTKHALKAGQDIIDPYSPNKVDLKQLFEENTDISLISEWLMAADRSPDQAVNLLVKALQEPIIKSEIETRAFVKEIDDKLDKALPHLKRLAKKGSIFGIYEPTLDEDGNILSYYDNSFFESQKKMKKEKERLLLSAGTNAFKQGTAYKHEAKWQLTNKVAFNPTYVLDGEQEAADLRDNLKYIDKSLLKKDPNFAAKRDKHNNYLAQTVSERRYDLFKEKAKAEAAQYLAAFDLERDSIIEEANELGLQGKDFTEYVNWNTKLFVLRNNPIVAADYNYSTAVLNSTGKYGKFFTQQKAYKNQQVSVYTRDAYLTSVPRRFKGDKRNYDMSSGQTTFYNSKMDNLINNNETEVLELIDLFSSVTYETYNILPESRRTGLRRTTLPFVEMTLWQTMMEAPLTWAGLKERNKKFWRTIFFTIAGENRTGEQEMPRDSISAGIINNKAGEIKRRATENTLRRLATNNIVSDEDLEKARRDGTYFDIYNEEKARIANKTREYQNFDLRNIFIKQKAANSLYRNKNEQSNELGLLADLIVKKLENNKQVRIAEQLKNFYRGYQGLDRRKLVGKTGWKLFTELEKEKKAELEASIELYKKISKDDSRTDEDKAAAVERLKKAEKELEKLGSRVHMSEFLNPFLMLAQLGGLAWNMVSPILNMGIGVLNNKIEAADGRVIDAEGYRESLTSYLNHSPAFSFIAGALGLSSGFVLAPGLLSMGAGFAVGYGAHKAYRKWTENKDAEGHAAWQKTNAFADRTDLMQQVQEEIYKTATGSSLVKLRNKDSLIGRFLNSKTTSGFAKAVNPYLQVNRAETINQYTLAQAMLRKIMLKDNQGNPISALDALNTDGTFNKSILDPEQSLDDKNVISLEELTIKLTQNIKNEIARVQGDYRSSMRNIAKNFSPGRAMLQFKTWLPERLAIDYETEKVNNNILDPTTKRGLDIKGRIRSVVNTFGINSTLAGMFGVTGAPAALIAIAGGSSLLTAGMTVGALGAIIYTLIHHSRSVKKYDISGREALGELGASVLKNFPILGRFYKKDTKTNEYFQKFVNDEFKNVDAANMRAISATMAYGSALMMAYFMFKLLKGAADDDEELKRAAYLGMNLSARLFSDVRLSTDIQSAADRYSTLKGLIPAWRAGGQVFDLADPRTMMSTYEKADPRRGIKRGDSKWAYKAGKLTPGMNRYGQYEYLTTQVQPMFNMEK